jgi:hypothetical protein
MNKHQAFPHERVRSGKHGAALAPGVRRSDELRLAGCAYPDAALSRRVGGPAELTLLSVVGLRRWEG